MIYLAHSVMIFADDGKGSRATGDLRSGGGALLAGDPAGAATSSEPSAGSSLATLAT
ncbi:hypothetical protein AB0N89_07245 [Amycolatopsis sp. NPDC089917]|uniref:hypothetical protein n=1 Tax=Amycolatopsis sp. NPDC089917 TaxID=3155187 RepID=UPI003449C86F